MSAAHTPGPWGFALVKGGDRIGVTAGGRMVAEVVQPGRDWSDKADTHARCDAERAANARLIAAAPDMLEAVLAGQAYFDKLVSSSDSAGVLETKDGVVLASDALDELFDRWQTKARAALVLAKGTA